MNRWDIINHYMKKYEYKTYLEIGVAHGRNFRAIDFEEGWGVDPDLSSRATHKISSDDFFALNDETFDCVFVDGLHHKEQTFRDILNSVIWLNKGGTILVHDCNPPNEISQRVPREVEDWWGDVWVAFRAFTADLDCYVLGADTGIGVLRGNIEVDYAKKNKFWEMPWKIYERHYKNSNLMTLDFWTNYEGYQK